MSPKDPDYLILIVLLLTSGCTTRYIGLDDSHVVHNVNKRGQKDVARVRLSNGDEFKGRGLRIDGDIISTILEDGMVVQFSKWDVDKISRAPGQRGLHSWAVLVAIQGLCSAAPRSG